MTVRSKTLVITGATLLVLVAIVLATSLTLRMKDYVQFEEQGVSEDVQRVVSVVHLELEGLDRTAADYAGWDDTYAYAADRNQAYVDENFIDDTLRKNELSLAVVLNSSGEMLFAKAMDLGEGKEIPLPAGLDEHLKPGSVLVSGRDPENGASGLLAIADSNWLIASRPILTSAYTGPARGTIIFARRVDERFMSRIRELMGVSVCICGQGTDTESPECAAARRELSGSERVLIRPFSDRVIRGFTMVDDLYGRPALLLRVDEPRKYRSQFFAGLWLFALCTTVALLVLGGISIYVMDRHVLGRLGMLISFMKGVGADENLSARLTIPGGDELTELADSTNEMLAALERGAAERLHAQEALRGSEAKYRELVQSANSIIMRWDVNGNITFFNEYAQSFFGYNETEVLGKNVVGTIVPETESTGRDLAAHVADVCRRTHLYRVNENENIRKDGTRVWVSWTNRTVLDASGNVTGILSVGTDITDRRRAELAMRESEQKYRRLVELAQEGVWQIDEDARTTFVNPRMAEMLGYGADEMAGRPLFDFVDEDTKRTMANSLRTSGSLNKAEREVTLTAKDGTKIVTFVAAAPVIDVGGRYRGSVAVVADITDLKRASEALRERQARLESILRAAPTGIGVLVDRVFTEVNENFCRMLGYSKDELIGQPSRMIYPSDEDYEYVGREKYRQISRAGVGTVETRFLCKDGRVLDILLSSSPVVPGDNRAGVTVAALDITERKRVEQSLREERQLFVAGPVVAFRWINAEDWPLEFVSENVRAQFGYGPSDFTDGRVTYTGIIHGDDLQRVLSEVELNTSSGAKWYEQEYRLKHADGKYRWVHDFTVVVRNASGAVTHYNGYVQDITESREAQEALSRERNLLRTLIDILPDCIYVMDRNGRKIMANPADVRSIGARSMEDVLGKTDFDLYPREVAAEFYANDQQVISTGRPLLNKEEVMPSPDGHPRTLLTTKVPLRDDQGRVVGLVGIGRDITDRKAALEALQESEERYRTLFESMTNAYIINELLYDESGAAVDYRIVDVNQAWERIIGTARDKAVGRTYSELFGPIDPDWLATYDRIVSAGKSTAFEKYSAAFDKWFEAFAYHLGGRRFAVTFADVTERHKAEEEIKALRGQIDFILGATKTGIDIIDSQFNVRFVDPEWAKVYGDYAGRKCYAYFMDRSEPCPGCGISRALETKQVTVTEEVLVREGNRPIQVTTLPYQDAGGEWLVAEVNVDISDRKRAEEALRDSEHRYRALFGEMQNGFALHEIICDDGGNPVDYRFLEVNPAFERMTGLSREAILGKTVLEVLPNVDRSLVATYGKVALTGTPAHFEVYEPQVGKYFEVAAYSPEKGRFGVTMSDVTERVKAIRSIRAREEEYRTLTENSTDVIARFDRAHRCLYVNSRVSAYLGKSPEDWIGKTIGEAGFASELASMLQDHVSQVFDSAKTLTGEFEVDTAAGRISAEARFIPEFYAGGKVVTVLATFRDISDRKRLEAQLLQAQKMEAIGQLAGGIAHDFNNLLTGILGYANMLKLDSAPGSQTFEAAGTIEKAAERATELTKQLLGFARRGKYLRMPVDVHSLVQEVVRLLSRTIEKSITISQRLSPRAPWVSGDPDQIEQMILNLAVNARDAMPDGGELSIETEIVDVDEAYSRTVPDSSPGKYVRLTVTDTGCGIPEEVRGRIFEPFFTTKERGKGTGMGLAMVYGVVKNHGGFIRLQSEVGEGARFDVYLPASDETLAPPRPHAAPARGSGRILFVDDEAVVRNVASDMLRSLGYEVTPAVSGDEAVDILMRDRTGFDLAIIDLVMPGLDARECFRKLRVNRPSLRAILSSGYGLNGKAQETVDDGMLGFIQKPYTLADLAAAVDKALRAPDRTDA